MNLVEKERRLLEIKKEIAWISAEFRQCNTVVDFDHVVILYDYFRELINEIGEEKIYFNFTYLRSLRSLRDKMCACINRKEVRIEVFPI